MLCQRCGLCCFNMWVVIRVGDKAVAKPGDICCPHLKLGSDNKMTCAVHDEPWYKDTPCFVYGNSDLDPDYLCKRGQPCGVGLKIIEHGGLSAVRPIGWAKTEDLEVLGDWPELFEHGKE